jgi:hypothetical protein
MNASQERMIAKMWIAEMTAWQKEMMACQESMEACLESKEPASVEVMAVALHEEVPKEEATVESFGGPKKQNGDRNLAIGRRRKLKKMTQGNCQSRKKLFITCRRMTHHAIPACREGRGHKGPTLERGQWMNHKDSNGIRDRDIKEQLPKTTGNGIRGRSRRQELRLGTVKS